MALPDVIEKPNALGAERAADSPEKFGSIAHWGTIIRRLNLKID